MWRPLDFIETTSGYGGFDVLFSINDVYGEVKSVFVCVEEVL